MHRVLELEPREPAAMQLRPSRPPVMQPGRNRKLGSCWRRGTMPAPREGVPAPGRASPHAGPGTHTAVKSPARRSFARLDASSLDPIVRPFWDLGTRNNDTAVPTRGQLELDPVTARSRVIAEAQLRAFMVELLVGAFTSALECNSTTRSAELFRSPHVL